MAYTDVISLSDAKEYLGVDDTHRDSEITRMIGSALSYIENATNIIFVSKDEVYYFKDNCAYVYDFPINTIDDDLPSTTTVVNHKNYSVYQDSSLDTITLNVGSNSNIPAALIETGYSLLKHLFDEGDKSNIPVFINKTINSYKRFIF